MDSAAPSVPQRLGKYWIVAPLGKGGMARVDLAVEDGADEVVVLKQLHESLESHSDVTKRFLREAKVASMLDHPHIARVLDAGVEDGHRCIAMEFVAGLTFEELNQHHWRRQATVPPAFAVAMVRQVLEAVEFAHELRNPDGSAVGLVHRDLSTKNLILDFRGDTQIIDFGIAKGAVDDHRTATGMLMGTPLYMSPEQARGERVDRRSDLYTVGVVLWELLAGRRLVRAKGRAAMLRAVVAEPPDPLPESVPHSLRTVVAKALAKDANTRFQSASEFLRALVPAAAELGLVAREELAHFAQTVLPHRKEEIDRQYAEAIRVATEQGLTRMTAVAGLHGSRFAVPGAGAGASTGGPSGGARAGGFSGSEDLSVRPGSTSTGGFSGARSFASAAEGQLAPPTDWASGAPVQPLGRPPWLWGLIGAAGVAAVAAAAWVWVPSSSVEVRTLGPADTVPRAKSIGGPPGGPSVRASEPSVSSPSPRVGLPRGGQTGKNAGASGSTGHRGGVGSGTGRGSGAQAGSGPAGAQSGSGSGSGSASASNSRSGSGSGSAASSLGSAGRSSKPERDSGARSGSGSAPGEAAPSGRSARPRPTSKGSDRAGADRAASPIVGTGQGGSAERSAPSVPSRAPLRRLRRMLREYEEFAAPREANRLMTTLEGMQDVTEAQRRCIQTNLDAARLVGSFDLVDAVAPRLREAIACLD